MIAVSFLCRYSEEMCVLSAFCKLIVSVASDLIKGLHCPVRLIAQRQLFTPVPFQGRALQGFCTY